VITRVAEGTAKDVDRAVAVAKHTFETSWGLKVPGSQRGRLLNKLADLLALHSDELAAIEVLDNGKTFGWAMAVDIQFSIETLRYYAGWADKIHGQVIETHEQKLAYTRHEPIGVVGQIIPWNFPCM
jgi:aldehyde dehydrogenase (NAD+)